MKAIQFEQYQGYFTFHNIQGIFLTTETLLSEIPQTL